MKQNLEEFKNELVAKFNKAFCDLEERYKNKDIQETITKMLKSAHVEINVIFLEHPRMEEIKKSEERIKQIAQDIAKGKPN